MMMVPTKIWPLVKTPLLSWGTKTRMGLEFFRRPRGPQPDRSVSEFLLDHYGQESIDYLAEPLLAGVYGGDPKAMSVNSVLARFVEIETQYGSLSRGVLTAPKPQGSGGGGSLFRTLKNGLSQVVEKLAPYADRITGSVDAVERLSSGFRVKVNGDLMEAEQLIVATPAYVAAGLVEPFQPDLSALLMKIPYTSSTTMSLGYRKGTFDHPLNGFGFLVPKRERGYLTACTWVNNKFSYRAPEDVVLLRCFLGGEAYMETDEFLVDMAKKELRRIMGLQAEPLFHNISRWPAAMAQFTVGHATRMEQIDSLTGAVPGLHLIGNGYRGIGLPDCVRSGRDVAAKIGATAVSLASV